MSDLPTLRRPHHRRALAATGTAALAAAPLTGAPVRAAEAADPAGLTAVGVGAWLDEAVPAELEKAGIPGAAVSVVADGGILTACGYGEARTADGGGLAVPVDPGEARWSDSSAGPRLSCRSRRSLRSTRTP